MLGGELSEKLEERTQTRCPVLAYPILTQYLARQLTNRGILPASRHHLLQSTLLKASPPLFPSIKAAYCLHIAPHHASFGLDPS